jgi:integrase
MPSAWVERRRTSRGEQRYVVKYALGGRESRRLYGGSFRTRREALSRRAWIDGELAAMRVPDFSLLAPPAAPVTLGDVAERWRSSRVDVSEGTATTHRVNLGRILPSLGQRPVASLTASDVAELVGRLHSNGIARETIRKTRATLAMVLDFADVHPNPARAASVKLPPDEREEVNPPTAAHIEAVWHLLAHAYRLPLLVLDATGMRVGELERLCWGDVDELSCRWRVSRTAAKTRRARWVPVPAAVFAAVVELVPRDDRDLAAPVFADFGAARLRTALRRACRAAGVPEFSPHQLRHRRATLWHLSGRPVVEAAAWLGHSPQEHLRTYAHATLVDRDELDYDELLRAGSGRTDPCLVPSWEAKTAR